MGKLTVLCGDIVSNEILKLGEAIVLPTNPMMRCGAGVSGAIFKKAGVDALEKYCEKTFGISYYNAPGVNEMKVTDVRITPGLSLPCRIIFAQGPKKWEYEDKSAVRLLIKTYQNVLEASVAQGFRSVLIPALGTGEYGFTHLETSSPVMELLSEFVETHDLDIYFVVYDEEAKAIYDVSLICIQQAKMLDLLK
ncbi:MAG: macro domain-containing protein [Oscillospiraceae bacterium]|nr:macro domain-containing protein [Oscillospiraceae bacterium]